MNGFVRKDVLPEGFLDAPVESLAGLLGGPTVFYLKGRRDPPLFVSTLLHGNEPSGLLGIQRVLKKYQAPELPRSLILLIGNVDAASKKLRRLPGEQDFNRIWNQDPSPLGLAATALLTELKKTEVFAGVDIHDNTGTNPHYACVSKSSAADLQLATLFNHIAVFFTYPDSALSVNLAKFCPAVTLECGKAGAMAGVNRAAAYVDALMHLDHLPERIPVPGDLTLFRAVARMKVNPGLIIETGVGPQPGKFILPPDLDHLNFSPLKTGRVLGFSDDEKSLTLDTAPGIDWCHSRNQYVKYADHKWQANRSFTPGMLTLNARSIHDDCLGYIMEPMALEGSDH